MGQVAGQISQVFQLLSACLPLPSNIFAIDIKKKRFSSFLWASEETQEMFDFHW